MTSQYTPGIETIIKEYLEFKEKSILLGKKRLDLEKEYNRLLTKYDGNEKQYTLDHADKIYKTYLEMMAHGQQSESARTRFSEAEEKLREVGQILFEATINANISMDHFDGQAPDTRSVTISYNNGQPIVS